MNLTSRQIKILQAIIEEYIETAFPVGSETLEKKYSLAVSPATIRNEMVALTRQGMLKKPHTSAGRIPTPIALKYYVKHLLKPDELPVSEEVSVKEQVWDTRHKSDLLIAEATRQLASRSSALALTVTDSGNIYHAGAANILDFPEFFDIDLTKTVLALLDRRTFWQDVYARPIGDDPFYLLLGEEFGDEMYRSCSFLYVKFKMAHESGMIGIVGPYRLQYGRLIPMVQYFGDLLTELGR